MAAPSSKQKINVADSYETTDATPTISLEVTVPANHSGTLYAQVLATRAAGGMRFLKIPAVVDSTGVLDVGSVERDTSSTPGGSLAVTWVTNSGKAAVRITGIAAQTWQWTVHIKGILQNYPLS